jgi:hypothetical protein
MAVDLSALPQDLVTGLLALGRVLEARGIRYALIGGVAAGYRSQPRYTQDLDFILQVPQLALPGLLDDLQEQGFSFDPLTTIRQWTQEHMTVLAYGGVRVDWLKPVLPCYQHVIDTASAEQLLGAMVRIASAEGLILTKLLSFRAQDQLDIVNLLAANRGELDLDFIRREWQTVVDAGDPRTERFEALVREFYVAPSPTGDGE